MKEAVRVLALENVQPEALCKICCFEGMMERQILKENPSQVKGWPQRPTKIQLKICPEKQTEIRRNPQAGIVLPVERLYCKRPIQCLASSKILTPPTLSLPGECVSVCIPLPLVRGENTLAGLRGVGGSIFWKMPSTQLYTLHM
jgi:hypothetical protein